MFKFNQSDIKKFPLQDYCDKSSGELLELSEYHQLYNFQQWFLPQLWGVFQSWRVIEPRWKVVCEQNIQDKWMVGCWRVATQLPRGHLLKNQTKTPKYGALTPFVLGAIRESLGINYSSWDLSENFALLEKPLLDSVLQPCPNLTKQELLAIRQESLVFKSGAKRGQGKNPETTWSVGELRGTSLWGTTALQKVMMLQIWLAHPRIRHNLQILDPYNIDNVPEPLLDSEVLQSTKQQVNREELPWLLP